MEKDKQQENNMDNQVMKEIDDNNLHRDPENNSIIDQCFQSLELTD